MRRTSCSSTMAASMVQAEILCKLRREGLNLTVLQNGSRLFNEAAYNTQLLHQAISERGADWVAFLDADEFIDDRSTPLLDLLGNVSPLVLCAHVMLTNYHPTCADDLDQLIVPSRIQWVEQRTNVPKVIVRANVVSRNVIVQDGAHGIQIDGGWTCPHQELSAVSLAHYPERSAFQALVKFVRGRSRVLTTGSIPPTATHYSSRFDLLRNNPQQLLRGDWIKKFQRSPRGMEHDPITYRGGPLRYTEAPDELIRAITAMMGHLDMLSRQHGRLLDECPGARKMAEQWASTLNQISA